MIETYNENNLHYELKRRYCGENGKTEQKLEGFTCDIICGDGKIIEIQTGNFGKLRNKLETFLHKQKVELIYPISVNTYIRLLNADGSLRSRRKSPKHGCFYQIFKEFYPIYYLLNETNLKIRLVYVESETIKIDDKKGRSRWKRPRITDRKLLGIKSEEEYSGLTELTEPILQKLPYKFTTADIRKAGGGTYSNYIACFLQKTGMSIKAGKDGKCNLYKKKR